MFVAPRPYFVPPKLDDPTLICHYLDTSVHSTGNDSSGNAHTGVTSGIAWGYGGRAVLNNASSSFRVPDHADLRVLDDLTVRCWTKNATTDDAVFSRYDTGTDDRSWSIQMSGTGLFSLTVSDDGTADAGHRKVYNSTVAYNDDEWHQLGFTFATGTLLMYMDGAEVAPTKTVDAAITAIHAGTTDLMLGCYLTNDVEAILLAGSLACCGMWSEVKAESWFAEDYARR